MVLRNFDRELLKYLLDNPAPLHAGKDVFHHDTDPADHPIQHPLRHT
jgi:hypothetical protein